MQDSHMIVMCKKCHVWYDMDFEESIDDEHEECYSEDWDIFLVPCGIFIDCDNIPDLEPQPVKDWVALVADKPGWNTVTM